MDKWTIKRLTGGDINVVFAFDSGEGRICVKVNNPISFPGMFETEKKGLELLGKHSQFTIPFVQQVVTVGEISLLFMEYIESAPPSSGFWEDFGRKLAHLHSHSADQFGLSHSNYIGSLAQINELKNDWPSFYAECRILPMLKLARANQRMSEHQIKRMENLLNRTSELMTQEAPALIHGDLWSGNYHVDSNGAPSLIDPSVAYSHREMDIAMMHLFGGFSSSLYDSYHEVYPLVEGWRDRIELFQLYPLMVHVNLFGSSYVPQVMRIVERYL